MVIVKIKLDETNRVLEAADPTGVRLAPNPVADLIQFFPDETGVFPEAQALTIFNSVGTSEIRLCFPDLSQPIAAGRLSAGVYFYLLETSAGPVSGKFIKQ